MQENEKFDLIDAIKKSFRSLKLFFKEFKWDKAHVNVLLKFFLEALFFAFIITLDLCLKDYLYDFLQAHGGHYAAIDGVLDLVYSENTGMGFGLFKGGTTMLSVMTGIVIAAIILYLLFVRRDKAYIRVPLIMVAAGGIGNLVDRVAFGYVRDFFMFAFWDSFPIFNVADSFITVGAIALIIGLVIMLVKESKGEWKPATAEETASGASDATAEQSEQTAAEDDEDNGAEQTAAHNGGTEAPDASENADNDESAHAPSDNSERVAFTVTPQTEEAPAPERVEFTVEPADKAETKEQIPTPCVEDDNVSGDAPQEKKSAKSSAKGGKRSAGNPTGNAK